MTDQLSSRSSARIRLWSLREDVLIEDDPDDENSLVLFTRWGEIRLPALDTIVRDWLRRMSLGPVTLENVVTLPDRDTTDNPEYVELMRVLELVSGVLVHSVGRYNEVGPLVSAVPIVRDATFVLPDLGPDDVVRLSRFAVIRAVDKTLVIESALAGYRVVLHRPLAISLLGQLAGETRFADMGSTLESDRAVQRDVVSNLVAAGVAVVAVPDPESGELVFGEDTDPSLMPWSHHDLLFHTRSTPGYTDVPPGAVVEPGDREPPAPVTKPAPSGKQYALHRPPMPDKLTSTARLNEVVESWRTYRHFGPITAEELGELLYRTARVRACQRVPGLGGEDDTDYPGPGMGEVHALELYLTLDRCPGMPRGSYYYDPVEHVLTRTSTSESALAYMLDGARIAGGMPQRPPALITMTARVSYLSALRNGNVYAMALTQVGLLQQTMGLVATAMELASRTLPVGGGACAVGPLGLDWPAEVVVGEFAIGAKP